MTPRFHLLMVEAEEIETLSAPGEVGDTGLLRMQLQPSSASTAPASARARSARSLVGRSPEMVAVPRRHPEPVTIALPCLSRTCKAILASNGEIGEPCGVPAVGGPDVPSSNTPTRSHDRISRSIAPSHTRRATWAISASCPIEPNEAATHYPSRGVARLGAGDPAIPSV